MKKPKDVDELASRLASAGSMPLVPPAVPPAPAAPPEVSAVAKDAARLARAGKGRKAPKRSTVALFLRLSPELYERYDGEAVRRTKATGRGVTVQQVILDRLAEASA